MNTNSLPVEMQIAANVLARLFMQSEQQKLDEQKETLRTAFYNVLANHTPENQKLLIDNAMQQFQHANPRKNVVFVNGVTISLSKQAPHEIENLADAGWIKVTDIGGENLYFKFKTDCGQELDGYCKCL